MDSFQGDDKIFIGLVGLPAHGKAYIARKLSRYLNWVGFKAKAFNISQYRKSILHGEVTLDFFDPKNEQNAKKRNEYGEEALNDINNFFELQGGMVAIYDGINTTKERRSIVRERILSRIKDCKLIWIESLCEDESIVSSNIRKVKVSHEEENKEQFVENYLNKVREFRKTYETISKMEYKGISFIKLINFNKERIIFNMKGYLESKIIAYVINLRATPSTIYLTRPGQSIQYKEKVGGDPDLSERGLRYCTLLNDFLRRELNYSEGNIDKVDVKVLTSTMLRGVNSAKILKVGTEPISLKILDEIKLGVFNGMTYDEMKDQMECGGSPRGHRYSRGESYLDVINRIEPIIFEIESSDVPLILVAHSTVLKCLYSYFNRLEIIDVPNISIPKETLIKLEHDSYTMKETRFHIDHVTGDVDRITDQMELGILRMKSKSSRDRIFE